MLIILTVTYPLSTVSAATYYVTVNPSNTVRTNVFTPGFQLDDDINRWPASSTLQQLSEDADLKLVRFFSHRVEPCTYWYESSKTGSWNWGEVDGLVEDILAIGAEPLITLGFYSWAIDGIVDPRGMATNPTTGLPYAESWGAYCAEWVKHFKQKGYPVRYYEIVNEPYHYWKDDGWPSAQPKLSYYVQLYNAASIKMKAQNSNVKLSSDACIMKGVLDYFISNGERLDYISYHGYGSGSLSTSDQSIFSAAETNYIGQSTSYYGVEETKRRYKAARGFDLDVIKTENNLCYVYRSGTDPRIQQMQGALYQALTYRTFMEKGYLHNVYFHFASRPSDYYNLPSGGYGFGMVSLDNYGDVWYPYLATKMIGTNLDVGDIIVESESSSNDLRVISWIHNNRLKILLIHKSTGYNYINLQGLSGTFTYQKISNAISWRNAAIQTGSISASQTLTFNGYTIMLLDGESSATPPPPPPPPSGETSFEDGFESGNYQSWSDSYSTSGGSLTISSSDSHHGTYSARTLTDGGSREEAYITKNVNDDELYVRQYIKFENGLPFEDNSDRVYLTRIMNGNEWLLAAGIRRNNGVDQWMGYFRDGSSWIGPYYADTPNIEEGKWYCLEVHWKSSSSQGVAEIYVDGVKRISRTGLDTNNYGNAETVDIGQIYATNLDSNLILYSDCIAFSDTYIGQESVTPPPPPSGETSFEDGFESGNYNNWDDVETTSGETAAVVNWGDHYAGNYHARYSSDSSSSSENAYLTKTVNEDDIYVRGYYKIPLGLSLRDNSDRLYLIQFLSGSELLTGAGIRRDNGVDKWIIFGRDGTSWVDPEYSSSPSVNGYTWYCVELHWKRSTTNGIIELYVNGNKILDITGINTDRYGNVNGVKTGIVMGTNLQQDVIVYSDNMIISDGYIGPN